MSKTFSRVFERQPFDGHAYRCRLSVKESEKMSVEVAIEFAAMNLNSALDIISRKG